MKRILVRALGAELEVVARTCEGSELNVSRLCRKCHVAVLDMLSVFAMMNVREIEAAQQQPLPDLPWYSYEDVEYEK